MSEHEDSMDDILAVADYLEAHMTKHIGSAVPGQLREYVADQRRTAVGDIVQTTQGIDLLGQQTTCTGRRTLVSGLRGEVLCVFDTCLVVDFPGVGIYKIAADKLKKARRG